MVEKLDTSTLKESNVIIQNASHDRVAAVRILLDKVKMPDKTRENFEKRFSSLDDALKDLEASGIENLDENQLIETNEKYKEIYIYCLELEEEIISYI
jgi:hypothetical protein